MKNVFTLAGHQFSLKNIQTCDFMSEETICFQADLYCDGKLLAYVSNEGHGGATFAYCAAEDRRWFDAIHDVISNVIWLTCQTGDIIYYDFGTIADEVLMLVEQNKEVARLQRDALVLRHPDNSGFYDPYLYTKKLGASVKNWVTDYPGSLAKKIAEAMDDGWEVLNTNIPTRIYKASEQWRDPSKRLEKNESLQAAN